MGEGIDAGFNPFAGFGGGGVFGTINAVCGGGACVPENRGDCAASIQGLERIYAAKSGTGPPIGLVGKASDDAVRAFLGGAISFAGDDGDRCGRGARARQLLAEFNGGKPVGLLDSILGGAQAIGGAILGGAQAVLSSAPVFIGAAQAIQATQSVLNGSASGATFAQMSPQMAAAMMAASGGAATQGSVSQEAFAAACRTDPACTAAIWQALQGGNVTPGMMNGSDLSEAQLAAAGIPPALIMALRSGGQGALNTLRSLIPGLAIGGAATLGVEALTGLLPSGGGTPKFPRSIFIADPRGGAREYKYRGRPVLYSGDISAARRVVKIAKRARSSRGGVGRRRGTASQILMLPAGHRVTACGKCGNGSCSGC